MIQEFDAELMRQIEDAVSFAIYTAEDTKPVFIKQVVAKAALSVIAPHYEKQISDLKSQIPQWNDDIKTRPIIFSAPMVKALLEGKKTQTRRVIKQKLFSGEGAHINNCPYGKVGNLLWVRETFSTLVDGGVLTAFYKADDGSDMNEKIGCSKFKPSIYMPRWASRLTLEITNIRVEQLHDISEDDSISEGCSGKIDGLELPSEQYQQLWESVNGEDSWRQNPFVWVIEFKVHKKNVDELLHIK